MRSRGPSPAGAGKMRDNLRRDVLLRSVGNEIQQVVVIDDAEFQVPQPTLLAKQVTRQIWVFGYAACGITKFGGRLGVGSRHF